MQEPEECCRKQMPLFESLLDTAKRIVQKPTWATEEQQNERLEICRSCPYFADGKCGICGCVMRLKVKAANVVCPHDPPKWTEV